MSHGIEKFMKYEKNAWVWDPFLQIRYAQGIKKNAQMKIFHVCPGEKFKFF